MPDPDALPMFHVYHDPLDYPGRYVVRRFLVDIDVTPDAAPWSVTSSLQEARNTLPRDLVRLERMEADDPAIVEVWL